MFVIRYYNEVIFIKESEDEAKSIVEKLMQPDKFGHTKCTDEFNYQEWTMEELLNYILSGLHHLDGRLQSHNL